MLNFFIYSYYGIKLLFLFLLASVLFTLTIVPLQAQEGGIQDPRALEAQENILRQRRQQEHERARKMEENRRTFKDSPYGALEKELPLGQIFKRGRQCVYMRVVRIKGDPLLSQKLRIKLVKELVRRCLGPREIDYLIRKITNHYVSQGHITTRVYIPAQDLNDGTFDVRVVPGYVESIAFDKGAGFRSQILTAFPFITGQRLNLRHIEQGLEQLNRLQSNKATMSFIPGKRAGGSRIIIRNKFQKPWSVAIGVSNGGPRSTGEASGNASLTLDNITLLNDSFTLSLNGNIQGNANPENFNRSLTYQYSFPFGYWTLSYNLTKSEYQSLVQGSFIKYRPSGNAIIEEFSLERIIFRSRLSKTVISGSSRKKGSTNRIDETKLISSSRDTKTIKININHSRTSKFGRFNFSVGYRYGTLSSLPAGAANRSAPALQFSKIETNLRYSIGFNLFSQNFNWQTNYEQQFTKEILYAEEQLSLGGLYTIRGFKEQNLSADIGHILRNELHWYIQGSSVDPMRAGFWGQPSIMLAYDIGLTEANSRSATVGSLEGVAMGISSYGANGHYSLTLARSIKWPKLLKAENVASLSMGLRF